MNVAAALSTGDPNTNANNPLVRKRMEAEARQSVKTQDIAAMNMDGTMNHFAFDSKPVLARGARAPAQKKQAKAFFSDSDDDDEPAPVQAYPVPPAQPQAYQAPVA